MYLLDWLYFLSDEKHFRGIIAQRRTIEIAVQLGDAESGARKQVFDLEAKEIAQCKREDETLLAAGRMLYVMD